jgi:hypothetical protein
VRASSCEAGGGLRCPAEDQLTDLEAIESTGQCSDSAGLSIVQVEQQPRHSAVHNLSNRPSSSWCSNISSCRSRAFDVMSDAARSRSMRIAGKREASQKASAMVGAASSGAGVRKRCPYGRRPARRELSLARYL